jgi:uncharacterized protein (TIGR03083 family)
VEISPRYDADPLIALGGPPAAIGAPLVRQRRRLLRELAGLTADQWAAPSRCEGWRVQDVVAHLVSTDQFWQMSVDAAVAGEPTRFLGGFDPKATPAAIVDARRDLSPDEVLATFVDVGGRLCDTFESLDDRAWAAIGESPAGHVTLTSLAHHALWDCWIHERDILQPLGFDQDEEPDEVLASLRYAAALAPAFALQADPSRIGALVVETKSPVSRFVVDVAGVVSVHDDEAPAGAFVMCGDAVELLDALSIRGPLPFDVPAEYGWLLNGLAEIFEAPMRAS